MKAAFFTLGCKVNQYETEAMKEKFSSAGFDVVSEKETADVYVINTCTVTNMADRKSRQFIRRAKSQNPDAIVAVVGCYAQVDPDAVAKIEGVDVILGTNEKSKIVDVIWERIGRIGEDIDGCDMKDDASDCEKVIEVLDRNALSEYQSDGIIAAMESRTRAYIKIQEGCDRFCTYCIIPTARGPVRSRDEDEIVEEARGLIKAGFKEIVLTGINTALYGTEYGQKAGQKVQKNNSDASGSTSKVGEGVPPIRKLIDKIAEISGNFRIRLSSLEPNVMRAEDVLAIVGAEKLCHHLHLSIQSGSNKVLKDMNRRYTREEYLGIVKALHDFDPYYGITTDIIVGFPGETEGDFMDSVELVKTAGLSKVHVFPYSQRRGTVAAEMNNQVSVDVKKERAKTLADVSEHIAREFHEKSIGSITKGLFEEIKGGVMTGYADNYTRIYTSQNEALLNTLIEIKMVKLYEDGVWVEPLV